jgi:hypothetical protein
MPYRKCLARGAHLVRQKAPALFKTKVNKEEYCARI